MQYTASYKSPLGKLLLAADECGLTGLWFEGQNAYAASLEQAHEDREALPVFRTAAQWLDEYFSGSLPDIAVPLHLIGTPFQNEVWDLLCRIPYGEVVTYGALARRLAEQRGLTHMSAQAIGGAVGHNPVSIIVPCHRVVGADGSLTGYAGGIGRKTALLKLEGAWRDSFFMPKRRPTP